MRDRLRQGAGLALCAAAFASLLVPEFSLAHALFADGDPNRPLLSYIWLGVTHMVLGWDHLLFIAGIVVLAGRLRLAAELITLFVIGHSTTLIVATLSGWQLNATLVDVVIALSLVYVGVMGVRGTPASLKVTGPIVLAFGLVHGLGLSTRLQALGLPETGVLERIILFNVGIEIGQLSALAIIVGLGTLLLRLIPVDPERARRVGFGLLLATGMVAAAILAIPLIAPTDETALGACSTTDAQPSSGIGLGGGHPEKPFFGPDEEAPGEDLAHVIGDGYVIVRYPVDLPGAQVKQLEEWIAASTQAAIAAADPEQSIPLTARTARTELTCTEFALDELTDYREQWFASIQQSP